MEEGGSTKFYSSASTPTTPTKLMVGIGRDYTPVGVGAALSDGSIPVTIEDTTVNVLLDWQLEGPVVRSVLKNGSTAETSLVAQYLDTLPTGLRVSFYGTKVWFGVCVGGGGEGGWNDCHSSASTNIP